MKVIIYVGRSTTMDGRADCYSVSTENMAYCKWNSGKGGFFSGADLCREEFRKTFPDIRLRAGEQIRVEITARVLNSKEETRT